MKKIIIEISELPKEIKDDVDEITSNISYKTIYKDDNAEGILNEGIIEDVLNLDVYKNFVVCTIDELAEKNEWRCFIEYDD